MLYLDVREWARRGWLVSGHKGSQYWKRGEELIGSIQFFVNAGSVRLSYARCIPGSGESETMCYGVRLDRTVCANIGGTRTWFRCPRCGDRRAVLYGLAKDGYFGCIRCLNLVYASEGEIAVKRAWRKQSKLQTQLSSKRPHGRVAERIAARIRECEDRRLTPLRTRLDPKVTVLRGLLAVGDVGEAVRYMEGVAKRTPLEAVRLYLVMMGAPSA